MNAARNILTVVVVSIFLAAPAVADWDVGGPYKMRWPQLPDLEYGLDVLDGPRADPDLPTGMYEKFLADDWECTQSGPVTEIHFWSSYLHDQRPAGIIPQFNLAIYEDIPEGPNGYSIPGPVLWSVYLTPTVEREYATAFEEFYDPNLDAIIGFDQTVWQYNFVIDPELMDPFYQEQGKVYWLGVSHSADVNDDGMVNLIDVSLIAAGNWAYGWKTSADHHRDTAVWTDVDSMGGTGEVVGHGPWHELIDPRLGEPIDLAFVIVPEPATLSLIALGGMALLARRRRNRQ